MPTTTKVKTEPAAKGGKTEFSKETYLFWYESMQLMRKFEERAGQLYGMQKIKGFCHLYIGHLQELRRRVARQRRLAEVRVARQ